MIASQKISGDSKSIEGGESSSDMEFVIQKRIIKEVMVSKEKGKHKKCLFRSVNFKRSHQPMESNGSISNTFLMMAVNFNSSQIE